MGNICVGEKRDVHQKQQLPIQYYQSPKHNTQNQEEVNSQSIPIVGNDNNQQILQVQGEQGEQSEIIQNKLELVSQIDKQQCFTDEVSKKTIKYINVQSCQFCKEKGPNLIKLICKHFYHENCLQLQQNKKPYCECGKKIEILAQYRIKETVQFKKELIEIKLKEIQHKFVHCSNSNCGFMFIFQKSNLKSKQFYCDICEKDFQYSVEMIKYIEATLLSCRGCEKEENNQNITLLLCGHRWHKQCLNIYLLQKIKLECLCGQSIKYSEYFQENERANLNKVFSEQLLQIVQRTNKQFLYCKKSENCTFLCIIDNDAVTKDIYCPECDDEQINAPNSIRIKQKQQYQQPSTNICINCNQPLFTYFITINQCAHKYHLLCANDLIQDNKILEIQCHCGQLVDSATKKQMHIYCIICQNTDSTLMQLDCMHYIHQYCMLQNITRFSMMKCCECQTSISTCLESPELITVKNAIMSHQQRLDPNYCVFCGNTGQNLLQLECQHSFHKDCLKEIIALQKKGRDSPILCKCGQEIKNWQRQLLQQQ